MNKLLFHDKLGVSLGTVSIRSDSPVMEEMIAAALCSYFEIIDGPAPLTVFCPDDGKAPPSLPRRGACIVIGDRDDVEDGHVFLPRPLRLDRLIDAALALAAPIAPKHAVPDYICSDQTRTVSLGEKSVSLTGREYELFCLLYSRIGEVVSEDEIAVALWGEKNSNACQVYVSYLRRKLDQIAGQGALVSVRGKGYLLRLP